MIILAAVATVGAPAELGRVAREVAQAEVPVRAEQPAVEVANCAMDEWPFQ
jgi:hypothetical protein